MHILLIATGGTIASRESGSGLVPVLSGEQLLEFVPAVHGLCTVSVESPFSVDSTDMTTDHRRTLAQLIWDSRSRYDGFVIAHGTDTLAYTAALLYHMLPGIDKPVILTGSMYPIGQGEDAQRNLSDAFRVACAGRSGVYAVLHGQIIAGNRVVKVHAAAVTAFRSVNAPPVGTIAADGTLTFRTAQACGGTPSFAEVSERSLAVVRLIPDLPPAFLEGLHTCGHVILQAYGAGGIPSGLQDAVAALLRAGTRVYITTQCTEGGADLDTYAVGQRAKAMGAISLADRTLEDAIAAIQCGQIP